MIDLAKIQYRVVVMDESKNQYNIKEYIENLGWEENDGELSVRTSFVAKNDKTSKGYLSKIIKPGCLVGVFATDGASQDEEVARGYVETWNPVEKSGGHTLKCTCYDELYKLQKSQDNRYFPSGTGTKSAIEGILDDWEIPQGSYQGPNASHGKTVENNKYLSDIIINLLDDAAKKGEAQCFVQARKGKTSVIPRGSNKTVYVFRTDNTQMFSQSISTADMITRVKVVGKADDDGRTSVEATVNGETKYGIRQRIYTRGKDESLADAKSAAQEILDDEGKIKKEIKVQSPDVPFVRKGDLVYVMSELAQSYYYVKGMRTTQMRRNKGMEEYKDISRGLKMLLDKAEEMGWNWEAYIEPDNRRTYVEIGQSSPAGEDFSMVIDFDEENQADSFKDSLESYYEDFDIDEHIEMWIEAKRSGIEIWNREDGPIARITVCITGSMLAEDETVLDTNNCPWAVEFVESNGLGENTGRTVRSGYCVYPVVKLNVEKIGEYLEVA